MDEGTAIIEVRGDSKRAMKFNSPSRVAMDTIDGVMEDIIMGRFLLALICIAGFVTPASATPHEARLPLHDGRVRVAELAEMFAKELHVPGANWTGAVKAGEVDLSGLGGCVFVRALN